MRALDGVCAPLCEPVARRGWRLVRGAAGAPAGQCAVRPVCRSVSALDVCARTLEIISRDSGVFSASLTSSRIVRNESASSLHHLIRLTIAASRTRPAMSPRRLRANHPSEARRGASARDTERRERHSRVDA